LALGTGAPAAYTGGMNRITTLLLLGSSLAALAPALPAASQTTVSDQRRAQIEAQAARWPEAKARALRGFQAMSAAIAADSRLDHARFQSHIDEAWEAALRIEAREQRRRELLEVRLEAENGGVPTGEQARRSRALSRLFELRMLFTYGNLMPRIMDETVTEDGRQAGRALAGPDWQIDISQDEMRALHQGVRDATGFPSDALDGLVEGR
jgi:hypothetical protein